ncbi:MAG: HYR domain-containing protein [Saprospiraceae bacterium]|nr:HYR domain-containing protein [Saprospiraceae bacterium]
MTTPVYTTNPLHVLYLKVVAFSFTCFLMGVSSMQAQVLTCPNNYTINLPTNVCTHSINYSSLNWSSTIPVFDPVFFPLQGTFLPTGVTTVTLAATDGNGNFHTCDFEVNILAFNSTNFVCPPQVTVSLGGDCEHIVTADDALNPNYTICNQDYKVELFDDNNQWVQAVINANQVNQAFNVRVTNNETGHACQTVIIVGGGETPAVTCPPNKVILCNEPNDMSHTGSPLLTGCFETVDISFTDNFTFTLCPDSIAYQIQRTIQVVSPNGSQMTCSQLITAIRFRLNQVQFPDDIDGVANPALTCSDELNLSQTTHPDLTGWPVVAGFLSNTNTHCKMAVAFTDNITQLCGDSYRIRRAWSVINLCNSQTRRDTQTIVVLDEEAPHFEIPESLFFSLSGGCVDSLLLPPAELIAECSNYDFQMVTPWGEFDENEAVWIHPDTLPGDYPITYAFTDACGNDSTQTMLLRIREDSLVACPANDTISCDQYFSVISPAIQSNNLQVLGTLGLPEFHLNCSFELSESDSVEVDNCGNGFFWRTITATNEVDTLTCEQLVSVQHLSNFEVIFPADTALCVSPIQANLPEPQLFSINCETVTVTFSDMIEPMGSGGCYNVLRTWYATNDCAFNGNQIGTDSLVATRRLRDNGDGQISYTQVIHINNNAPVSFPNGCEIEDKYVGASTCTANFILPTPMVEGCGSQLLITVNGNLGTVLGAPVSLLPGQYNVNYRVTDECGKMQTCSTSFVVLDTIVPSVACKTNYVVNLGANCTVGVSMSELITTASDNCSNNPTLSSHPDNLVPALTFGACELGAQTVDVWATDQSGNSSQCQATLIVEGGANCDCNPVLGGKIETDVGPDIAGVKVAISSTTDFFTEVRTNSTGNFLSDIPSGGDYILTPSMDTLPVNGVSTFDIVVIRKHILGIDTLDSPYKIIAADANRSNSVTTFDLVEIRKLILTIYDDFPNNSSWRFVDANYVFTNPLNPFLETFPEFVRVDDVTQDNLNVNFIGVKIGDANGSASTNFTSNDEKQE